MKLTFTLHYTITGLLLGMTAKIIIGPVFVNSTIKQGTIIPIIGEPLILILLNMILVLHCKYKSS